MDTSKYIEHLRTIHFSLILLCFVLIVSTNITPNYSLSKAETELSFLLKTEAITDDAEFYNVIDGITDKLITKGEAIDILSSWPRTHVYDGKKYWYLSSINEGNDENISLSKYLYTNISSIEDEKSKYFPIRESVFYYEIFPGLVGKKEHHNQITFSDIKNRWEIFQKFNELIFVTNINYNEAKIYSSNEEKIDYKFYLYKKVKKEDARYIFHPPAYKIGKNESGNYVLTVELSKALPFHMPNIIEYPFDRIELPINIEKIKFNYLEKLLTNSDIVTRNYNFDYVFPNISKLTKGLESLTLEDLNNFLKIQLEKEGERIEIFSTPVPIKEITKWGFIILLLVQIYFLTHFKYFRVEYQKNTSNIELKSPWIGLYDTKSSHYIFVLTILLIPFITTIFLLQEGMIIYDNVKTNEYLWVGLITSLFLSFSILSEYFTLHKITLFKFIAFELDLKIMFLILCLIILFLVLNIEIFVN